MSSRLETRCWCVETVAELLQDCPERLIRDEEERYETAVSKAAEKILQHRGRCLVLLSGPSASGKTTTANKLQCRLREAGRDAYTISLDNFYRGYGQAPQLPDGSYDYESIEALNLPLLQACMCELLDEGRTMLPEFDFLSHAPKTEKVPFAVSRESVVIFEGIHALNPLLRRRLPPEALLKIFVDVRAVIEYREAEWLTSRELRLTRRLLRDLRFRNSSLDNTMDMWRQVIRGEELYLFPYVGEADVYLNTALAYETALLGGQLLPALQQEPQDGRYATELERLAERLAVFEALPLRHLPDRSILREFVG